MPTPIINLNDLKFEPRPAAFAPQTEETALKYDAKLAHIAPAIGAKKLGYNITAVPPGKRAFPFHNHRVNEELFFILEGSGEVRIGTETYPVKKGDFIACPPGGPETAHQIINTGDAELKYLAVSTKQTPEIAEYPDSNKFGVLDERPAGADGKPNRFMYIGREELNVSYWDGE